MALADAVITIEPLEGIGLAKVWFKDIALGVPASDSESVFNPVEGIHIIIPPGAWLPANRRRASDELTLTVFELPANLGQACGPAIDLGPRTQRLAKPILISIPCASQVRIYSLNTTSLVWAADTAASSGQNNTAWAQTGAMGVHAAIMLKPAAQPPYDPIVGVIVGSVIGGIALLLSIALLYAYRRSQKVVEDQRFAQSELAFADV
jgi:hypothetical protein